MFFTSRTAFSENLVAMKLNLVNHSYVLPHTIQFLDSGYKNRHMKKEEGCFIFLQNNLP